MGTTWAGDGIGVHPSSLKPLALRSMRLPVASNHSCATMEPRTPYSRAPGKRVGDRNRPPAAIRVVAPTTVPDVSIVPSHPDLAAAELELLNVIERERQLERRLQSADLSRWDYVLIDAPPALNVLSINILVAARELVIPIEPHPLSLMVLRRLFETISRVRRLNPELRVHGFLPTKVHHSSRLAADMLTALREEFPQFALLPSVPLSVRGAESAAERTSILQYMPKSAIAAAYRDVGGWLEARDPRSAAIAQTVDLHV